MVTKSLAFLRINSVWQFYSELVHNTLFFDLLQHGVPQALALILAYAKDTVEAHGTMVVLLLGLVASVIQEIIRRVAERRGARRQEKKKRFSRPRDSKGRFIRSRSGTRSKTRTKSKPRAKTRTKAAPRS